MTIKVNNNKTIFVSIVVPSFNEEKNIERCLKSIASLNYLKKFYEVILVDNGSTDKTVKIVETFKNVFKLTIEIIPRVNVSALRNKGAKIAQGDIIAFLDADCTVAPNWLLNAIKYFDDETVGAVGCSHKIPANFSWVANAWHIAIEKNRTLGEKMHLPSGNLIVRKDYFFKVGCFDEDLITNEDYELCLRFRKHGLKIFSDPSIEAVHYGVPQTLSEFYQQQKWHGIHVLKVFCGNLREIKNLNDLKTFKAVFYGMYSLIFHLWLAIELFLFFKNSFSLNILLPLFAVVFLPILLAIKTTSCFKQISQLSTLYYIYGLARASSLISNISNCRSLARGV